MNILNIYIQKKPYYFTEYYYMWVVEFKCARISHMYSLIS